MNINIISGFLGAGKTTLLNKLLPVFEGTTAVIENEFGEVSVDSLRIDMEVPVHEIYAGCICCSLAADFQKTMKGLAADPSVDQILIEPSGVGQLSEIVRACKTAEAEMSQKIAIGRLMTVVDVSAYEDDRDQFGEFYLDQIRYAEVIFLSHMDKVEDRVCREYKKEIQALNPGAVIYGEDWFQKEGAELMEFINKSASERKGDILSEVEVPDKHSLASILMKDVCCKDEAQLHGWFEDWRSGKFGTILRAKGNVGMANGGTVQIDYTPHHYALKETKAQQELVFIGQHLNKELLGNCLKGGAGNGKNR